MTAVHFDQMANRWRDPRGRFAPGAARQLVLDVERGKVRPLPTIPTLTDEVKQPSRWERFIQWFTR